MLLAIPIFVSSLTVFPQPVAVLPSSLFFAGARSCYRQDKAGLAELRLNIIPLPSSEKKGTVLRLINTRLKKRGENDGERGRESGNVDVQRVVRERKSRGTEGYGKTAATHLAKFHQA